MQNKNIKKKWLDNTTPIFKDGDVQSKLLVALKRGLDTKNEPPKAVGRAKKQMRALTNDEKELFEVCIPVPLVSWSDSELSSFSLSHNQDRDFLYKPHLPTFY